MINTAFKFALALHGSYLNRIDIRKPTLCHVPNLYEKYPEIFEAFAWQFNCNCTKDCVFALHDVPSYNRSAYNLYARQKLTQT